MTEPEREKEPKIIVDEDWKAQAQAEKEALAREKQPEPAPTEPVAQAPPSASSPEAAFLPEASLAALVTMLATQAMIAMGQIAHPLTGKAERSLPEAKYLIDLVSMLEQKTQGNRTPQEIAMLSAVLHELRMAYVAAEAAPTASEPSK